MSLCHICMPVPSQDLDFHLNMSWSLLCLTIRGEKCLFAIERPLCLMKFDIFKWFLTLHLISWVESITKLWNRNCLPFRMTWGHPRYLHVIELHEVAFYNSFLWCALRFPRKKMLGSSSVLFVLYNIICICFRILVSNTIFISDYIRVV